MADVMGDSVVAEKAKLEPEAARGSTQSSCYSYRFFGLMCASPFSTWIYSWMGPKYVFYLLAMFPLSILPLVYWMGEIRYGPVASTRDQCSEIWKTVCSRSVWQPLAFVYIYNVLQVQNAAWNQYLMTALGFTAVQLNLIYNVACVLIYLGVLVYKYYLINWSWRFVYVTTTLLNGVFSILQVLLILGITFGLSPFLFALGDDAFSEFIAGIQFLPTTIMMVHLCPTGSEGASYAMFTTVNNSAGAMSRALSTPLTAIWDVSKAALAKNELTGMVNLTLLTTAIQVSGILFVGLLPRTKEELFELRDRNFGSSSIGGFIFLGVTFASILFSIMVFILNVFAPGWSGES
jgi:BT1 family